MLLILLFFLFLFFIGLIFLNIYGLIDSTLRTENTQILLNKTTHLDARDYMAIAIHRKREREQKREKLKHVSYAEGILS